MDKIETFGEIIHRHRTEKQLPLRKVAAFLDIDQAILSKIERGKRKASRQQVLDLAGFFGLDTDRLLDAWLSDKILQELDRENSPLRILQVAEEKVRYRTSQRTVGSDKTMKIKNVLKEFPAVKKAWLFGSHARGENTPESDIDILIDVPLEKEFTLFDIAEIQERLRRTINMKVDVVMLRALAPHVLERVRNDLKLIYEVR
ncbi:MAG: nucleotidyltransferase domain-containing protein [Bacteroidales bacterium]